MSKAKKPIYRYPGPDTLQQFLKDNAPLFNARELERQCKFPEGRMRYIVNKNGSARKLTTTEYAALSRVLVPKLTEFLLLMNLSLIPDSELYLDK